MNGLKNRKLLFVLGPVAALLMFAGTVQMVSMFVRPLRTAFSRARSSAAPDASSARTWTAFRARCSANEPW